MNPPCEKAQELLLSYSVATGEYFVAVRDLAALEPRGITRDARRDAEREVDVARLKCDGARLALRAHRLEHGC